MLKTVLFSLALVLGLQAQAGTQAPYQMELNSILNTFSQPMPIETAIQWKVGDSVDYAIGGGMITGTAHSFVREDKADGIWMQTDADLGFAGKQKIETLLDKNSGKILKLIVNGKEQTPPDAGDQEVIEVKDASVTVPKGTFACHFLRIRSKKDQSITQVWMKPDEVPVGGIVKSIQPTQMGDMSIELTDFKKN